MAHRTDDAPEDADTGLLIAVAQDDAGVWYVGLQIGRSRISLEPDEARDARAALGRAITDCETVRAWAAIAAIHRRDA